jgi:quinol monooxygenase YgiN
MYAMTGSLTAQPGKRGELVEILKRAANMVGQMQGCRLYLVTEDATDESLVVVFEMWEDKSSHDESLKDPHVRALIAEAMPILAGPPNGRELRVAGGFGA